MRRHRGGSREGPSQRQLRAGELVRHALVDIFTREEMRDPDLHGVSITVGEVRASPDLKHMTVFVAPLASGDARAIAAALTRASGFLRGKLAKVIELRHIPELHFEPDLSYEEARHIDELLRSDEVRRDLSRKDDA